MGKNLPPGYLASKADLKLRSFSFKSRALPLFNKQCLDILQVQNTKLGIWRCAKITGI